MTFPRVTFTGADDKTPPQQLAAIAQHYPWVEFAVLVSPKRTGTERYPSAAWRRAFFESGVPRAQRALHLCGGAVEAFIARDAALYAELRQVARVQINFTEDKLGHDKVVAIANRLLEWHREGADVEFILQYNQANAGVPDVMRALEGARDVTFLVDSSGGRGVAPRIWPKPVPGFRTAYAGGLGPGRMREALQAIAGVAGEVDVDMETGVRTDDRFDLDKVIQVVREVIAFRGGQAAA